MRVLIVGAGQAGAQAAISLRQAGFGGGITMVGEEPDLPYERPPLSKEYLAGEREAARLLLRPAGFWAERGIEVVTGCRIVAVDAVARTADAEDGRGFGYDRLIWAAGGHARRLPVPGGELPGVHVIRSRADVDGLRAELDAATRVVVVGGGYVGLESAAVLRKAGKTVTVVEAQARLLARVAGAAVGDFYAAEHRAQGVEVRLGAGVQLLEAGADGRVACVRLASGEALPADLVIVGVGLVPSVAPLVAAGADSGDGVRVDGHGRTTLPDVYAIGDCAHHPNRFAAGGHVRLESVANAVEMAKVVAGHVMDGDDARPYEAVPWFWSNQYDLRLQTVGLSAGHDAVVVRGDPASRSWSLCYLRAGAVVALDCISSPRDYVQGKALVERGAVVDPARLADPAVPLKMMLEG
ncbi:NAD(P)/FAD-dependent oxidoreductase [Sandaracinobacteroides saxicola]|uniref:NAD(P)/FAD-dependent oxidoreductase n=1 Tax=Sandaracinobacteroides saxicola TaxID=2759707 RepID=UPI001FB12677|nr:FAD-dependent oxidoreductase [Sandaracinobacteroides saxicola]